MKRYLFAAALLAISGCNSMQPSAPPAAAGFSDQLISPNRYRVSYDAPANLAAKDVADATLAHAAQLTLDKGNQWFEIKDQASADHKRTLEIVMGKGETLAGGAKIYDAKETLAAIKAAKKPARTSEFGRPTGVLA
jgi:hypothetical protein